MFTGIVEERAQVIAVSGTEAGARLTIRSGLDQQATKEGDSICIDGVCLTVVNKSGSDLSFDLAPETLRCSTLGLLTADAWANVERALKAGERLGGHFVLGHVDAKLTLIDRRDDGNSVELWFSLPAAMRAMIVPKGSLALSGISLTVGKVETDRFCVWLVPYTMTVTTLGTLAAGDQVNFEADVLARYVSGFLASHNQTC